MFNFPVSMRVAELAQTLEIAKTHGITIDVDFFNSIVNDIFGITEKSMFNTALAGISGDFSSGIKEIFNSLGEKFEKSKEGAE